MPILTFLFIFCKIPKSLHMIVSHMIVCYSSVCLFFCYFILYFFGGGEVIWEIMLGECFVLFLVP